MQHQFGTSQRRGRFGRPIEQRTAVRAAVATTVLAEPATVAMSRRLIGRVSIWFIAAVSGLFMATSAPAIGAPLPFGGVTIHYVACLGSVALAWRMTRAKDNRGARRN